MAEQPERSAGEIDSASVPCDCICMRTTLDLDQTLLLEALRVTGARTKTDVVEMGLQALIQRAAQTRLARLFGKMPEAKAPPRRRAEAQR